MVTRNELIIKFQSTPLIRGETFSGRSQGQQYSHFNPLPSYEGRPTVAPGQGQAVLFQSTPLVRGETALPKVPKGGESFQSTPLMRGETG